MEPHNGETARSPELRITDTAPVLERDYPLHARFRELSHAAIPDRKTGCHIMTGPKIRLAGGFLLLGTVRMRWSLS
jgi:hypothetical protein